jgi:glycosyltransferase involved in cell wall biosynthesis
LTHTALKVREVVTKSGCQKWCDSLFALHKLGLESLEEMFVSDKFSSVSQHLRLSLIMPVFNEVGTFESTVKHLLKTVAKIECLSSFELIIVESNSTDGTREAAKGFLQHPNCQVIFESAPRGKGAAVRLGLELATGDVISIYDADAEYDPDDISRLLMPILCGETSFVLGTRHGGVGGMRVFTDAPRRAAVMNAAHNIFTSCFNIVYRVKLTDPFTMYKVFRTNAISGLQFRSDRFDFDWEIAAKLIRVGCVPVEIGVTYRSRSFADGKKVRFFRDPLTWIIALVRFRFEPLKTDAVSRSAITTSETG